MEHGIGMYSGAQRDLCLTSRTAVRVGADTAGPHEFRVLRELQPIFGYARFGRI